MFDMNFSTSKFVSSGLSHGKCSELNTNLYINHFTHLIKSDATIFSDDTMN